MDCGIYLIKNIINGKEYIGSSKNIKRRRYRHWNGLKKGIHENSYLQRSYNSYGKDAFHFIVLEHCEPDCLKIREDWWIFLLDTMSPNGYNLLTADRQVVAEETNKKKSASLKGKPWSEARRAAWNKDYIPSQETRDKISTAQIGKIVSEETRANISAGSRSGDPEVRAKISASLKGNIPWNKR